MPDNIIDKIHRMAQQQKNKPGLIFADQSLNPDEDDDDDDETYHDDNDDDSNGEDNDDDPHGNGDEPHHHNDNNNNNDDDDDEEDHSNDHDLSGDEDSVETNDDIANDGIVNNPTIANTPENNEEGGDEALLEDDPPLNDIARHPDNPPGEIPGVGAVEQEVEDGAGHLVNDNGGGLGIPGVGDNEDDDTIEGLSKITVDVKNNNMVGGYGLRNRRGHNYNHLYAGEDFVVGDITGTTLTTKGNDVVLETPQMSLKAGLRTFGDDGMKAVEKEMHPLHDRDVMKPIHKKCLTQEQRKEALAYLMFLKRKRCGKIKGRGSADGRKQRSYITKEDSTAPTVSTEAVFLTAVIDTMEGRNVVVLDVPRAYMQAKIDELVHVRFTRAMVTLLLEIDHDIYKDFVVVEKAEQVMYMELLKALYGTLRATRLFWQKLSKQLIDEWGFVPNKYDDCVVNKIINGQQMTVVWHVDDLKVSHVDGAEGEKFVRQMEKTFGKDTPLTVSRGQVHDYLV